MYSVCSFIATEYRSKAKCPPEGHQKPLQQTPRPGETTQTHTHTHYTHRIDLTALSYNWGGSKGGSLGADEPPFEPTVPMPSCVYRMQVSVSEAMPITERERLNLRLDRFSPICGEERHSVIAMAQE